MFQGLRQVFRFTLSQQLHSKKFVVGTLLTALILFLLPASIMPLVEKSSYTPSEHVQEGPESGSSSSVKDPSQPSTLTDPVFFIYYTVDEGLTVSDHETKLDFSFLEALPLNQVTPAPGFAKTQFQMVSSLDEAMEKASADSSSLILQITDSKPSVLFRVLLPTGTSLSVVDAEYLGSLLQLQGPGLVLLAEGRTLPEIQDILKEATQHDLPENDVPTELPEDSAPEDLIRDILGFALVYVNVMLVYFLVLFYGQSVSNNVIMEKTSKLMDLFLISVKPRAMIFGKLLAVALAAIGQFSIWILALFGGFAVGTQLVYAINPHSQMMLLQIFKLLGFTSGFFSIRTILMVILMIGAGFFLYCSLAAIGGALASKPEDLSTTNVVFTLVLVASFMTVLFTSLSGLEEGVVTPFGWQDLIPFTSILVTPARIVLGQVTFVQGLISLSIVLVVSVLIIILSGKIYQMMAFYKGNPIKPTQILSMLKKQGK